MIDDRFGCQSSAAVAIGPSGPGSLACFSFMFRPPPRLMSALQELRGVLNKQLRVLVLRTMIAVGVQNELRVQQVLLQYERVHRINEHVVAAVDHERRLSDLLQVSIGIFRGSPHFCSAASCAAATLSFGKGSRFTLRPLPLKILPSGRLTPLRWSKEGPKPDLIGRIVLGSEDVLSFGG